MNEIFKNVKILTMPGIEFRIVEVTPIVAAEWLKRNLKNRKIKAQSVEMLRRDMENSAWYLTHQGIAFNDAGDLIDGQHRLEAIVQSKATVQMFVSTGWPAGGKKKTMDAVDRGVTRSIADHLKLQHGIQESNHVVQIANAIACACISASRVRKSSTHCVLQVVGLFPQEIKYVLETRPTTIGIRGAHVLGAVAMGRAVWLDKTSDFWTRLRTGENLDRESPVLYLRNWLMGSGVGADSSDIRNTTLFCLREFVEGRPMKQMRGGHIGSDQGLVPVLEALKLKVKKIADVYRSEVPEAVKSQVEKEEAKDGSPFGEDGIRVGSTLAKLFTNTDLRARVNAGATTGSWLYHWQQRGWVESAGVNQWRKTDKFPVLPGHGNGPSAHQDKIEAV